MPSEKIIDQIEPTHYNEYCNPCERGGIGRRTGFRILRLVHKGSSPFARTKKGLVIFEITSPFVLAQKAVSV